MLFVVVALLWRVGPALAHGGTVRFDEDSGPYHVVVVTNNTGNSGEQLITVVVTEKVLESLPNGDAVLNARITARMTGRTPGQTAPPILVVPPEPRRAAMGYYEAVMPLPQGGTWKVLIHVVGSKGAGDAFFNLDLGSGAGGGVPPGWTAWLAPLLVVPLLAVLAVYWARRRLSAG